MNLPKHEVLSVLAKRMEDGDTGAKRVFYPEAVAHVKNNKGKICLLQLHQNCRIIKVIVYNLCICK